MQESLGEDVGKAIQMLSTGIAGLILGFVTGWRLALVLLSVIPFVSTWRSYVINGCRSLAVEPL